MDPHPDMITILGHTAGGKTRVAAHVAAALNGAVISADSRQVYQEMDIGTGKDYDDYLVDGVQVKTHLVDICNPGEEYNVFDFQQDFLKTYTELIKEQILPILCGGTGLYIESILRQYQMDKVPPDQEFRKSLEGKSLEELKAILEGYTRLHNTTDIEHKKRAIRAIEIARYQSDNAPGQRSIPDISSLVFGIRYNRDERRRRITERLRQRLEQGMIAEAEALLEKGVTHEKMQYYGLEYKYLSLYLQGHLDYDSFFKQLNTAIHQFAKRQMTYFRGMERRGLNIQWLEGDMDLEEKVSCILDRWKSI